MQEIRIMEVIAIEVEIVLIILLITVKLITSKNCVSNIADFDH